MLPLSAWRASIEQAASRAAVLLAVVCALACAGCGPSTTASADNPSASETPATEQSIQAEDSANTEDAANAEAAEGERSVRAQNRARAYENALEEKDFEVSAEEAALHEVAKPEPKSTRYTVMVYMIGSNLESANAAATSDLEEIAESGIDFAQANVVVYAGGAKRWNTDIPTRANSVLDMARPTDDRIVAQTDSNASMGAAATLAEFIRYCTREYPADHTALVLWDHGGGPLWGYGYDEVSGGDGLLLSELRDAMEETAYAGGKKRLDWVGFDACLMGSLENVALWSDYAKWMVASEEVEPGGGWDYSFLTELNAGDDPQKIGAAIVSAYADYYKKAANAFSNPDVTMALYDLSKTDGVLKAFDGLAAAMAADMEAGGYADLNRARRAAKAFGLTGSGGRAEGYDLVDTANLAEHLAGKHPEEAEALVSAVGKLVAAHDGNVERACGVSLYFPGENRELYETFDAYRQIAQQDGKRAAGAPSTTPVGTTITGTYDEFIKTYTEAWLAASDVDWSLPEASSGADGLTLKLTNEQLAALSSASYTVMRETEPGRYNVLTCEVEIDPDGDGTLHVPVDPLVIASRTDIGRPIPGWFVQVESAEEKAVYTDTALYLDIAGDYTDLDPDVDPRVSATVTVAASENGYTTTIDSVNTTGEGVGLGGKNTVDVSQYSALIQYNYQGGMVAASYYSDGRVKPWEEWESDGWTYSIQSLENGFEFVALPASRFEGSFAAQIVVTDVNGQRHAVAPASLQLQHDESTDVRQVEHATELGTLTFNVMEDHAEVARYEGDDWTLDIPREIEGVPVTTIANEAFQSCTYLDELALPEGITTIGAAAFAHSGLYSLTLPSTLEHISTAAFSEMPKMLAFQVAGENPAVSVKDGVLFSADGKTLIAYPNAKGTAYRVPKGTETLGYGCFAGSDIAKVELPDSLRTIDRAAFFGCGSLASLELPSDLERIGGQAFDSLSGRAPLSQMHLGPKVSYVGPCAFNALALSSIEVDPANATYQSKGGVLLNAAGDAVVAVPHGTAGTIVIPDGVAAIGDFAFSDLDNTTDFILPASLKSCRETSFPRTYSTSDETGEETPVYTCTIHAPAGSFAESFAEKWGIAHDNETDPERVAHELETIDQDDITMAFWAYHDHATLVSVFDNADWTKLESSTTHTLRVPAEVSGVPVTQIDFGRAGSDLVSGNLDTANSIETLVLPSTLELVGDQAFSPLHGIKRFEFDGQCANFAVNDDVLLSADGKKLVAYPAGREGTYTVPDGVKEIGARAFDGASGLTALDIADSVQDIGPYACSGCDSLATVRFGRSVETIGNHAFSGCGALVLGEPFPDGLEIVGKNAFWNIASYEGLHLPDSLKRIGSYAFDGSYQANAKKELRPVAETTVTIGPDVTEVDDSSFAGLGIESFAVDEKNEAYRAEGPFLLTADGHSVAAFASGAAGEFDVPDGTREIDLGVFACAYKTTDVHLPASITLINGASASALSDEHLAEIRFHVPSGSYAERYAREHDLAWVTQ